MTQITFRYSLGRLLYFLVLILKRIFIPTGPLKIIRNLDIFPHKSYILPVIIDTFKYNQNKRRGRL